MNKYLYFFSVLIILQSAVIAQGNRNSSDTMVRYYTRLANSPSEEDKVKLETELFKLLKSDKEQDWLTARRFFYQAKKVQLSEFITATIKLRFPMGQVVRDQKVDTVFKEKDPVKKERLYQAWIKQFPPEKFGTDRIMYDYARNAVSTAYAEAGDIKKAIQYANMVETPAWKGEGWAGTANVLARKGHEKEAIELFKKARDNSYKFMTTHRTEPGANFAASGFSMYSNSLAGLLLKQKKYEDALAYIKIAHDSARSVRSDINSTYS
jgi:tetratricopeptide (TPR) repeat protein